MVHRANSTSWPGQDEGGGTGGNDVVSTVNVSAPVLPVFSVPTSRLPDVLA